MKKKYIAPEMETVMFDLHDATNNGEYSDVPFDPDTIWDDDPFTDSGSDDTSEL